MLLWLLGASAVVHAQILKPAEWQWQAAENTVTLGDTVELIFNVRIDKNWYLYSNDFDPDLGPMLTEFAFVPDASYALVGGTRAIGAQRKYDDLWGGEYTYFKGKGEFRQTVKILSAEPLISGSVSYQVCSDVDGKCIPFDQAFSFDQIDVLDAQNSPEAQKPTEDPVIKTDLFAFGTGAQAEEGLLQPATWQYGFSRDHPAAGDTLTLRFQATIDPGWYMYSSDVALEPGPVPARFSFEPNDSYALSGGIVPVGAKTKHDPVFDGEVRYFDDQAVFTQTIKVLKSEPYISGSIEYQVCSEEDGKCILLEEDFYFGDDPALEVPVSRSNIQEDGVGVLQSRDTTSAYTLLTFMLVAFLGGLAALLTPCVFPMIPMTVTFFTGRAKSRRQGLRNAVFYGFSIVLIYTLTGALLAPFMGPEVANELATNWIPNVLFFLIFLVFALSFLGLFEINLPNSWVNSMDRKADKGGVAGIFFMALTLVLVSFSCTGPIAGSLLVESAGGQLLKPVLGMFAFGLAFAVPFTLFAIFPEWLSALPKSGGWLNSVKVVLGFLELAFALKFLSVADQAYHWGILDREVYLAFWIVIFGMLALYLLGKIKLPGDTIKQTTTVPRLVLAIVVSAFVVYLIPGMFGAPLKALAGYLPPLSTHDFNLLAGQGQYAPEALPLADGCEAPKHAELLHFPHQLSGYFDYEQAMACGRAVNKPVFIDFTGHGCVNCREMEARVWSDPEVLKRLKEDFVLLALYVDDKTELPQDQWYTSEYDDKVKKSIGKQNADLQIRRFNNNAQPYYVVMNPHQPDGKPLIEPRAYDLDIQEFVAFLDEARAAYDAAKLTPQ